jgi:hypothetical protein
MSSLAPRRRDFEKTASTWLRLRHLIGLSLFTKTASASTEVRSAVGLWPYFFSNASISVPFISRDIGPSWAVPLIRAGGAVDDPLPSICSLAFG